MSIHTSFFFLNANDAGFQEAKNGTPEGQQEWEDINGPMENWPGAVIDVPEDKDPVEETNDEYGGWIIPVDKIPTGTTHIRVSRS